MAHTRRTLLLDKNTWDVCLDRAGRIALAEGGQATAQNVANESRLFAKDAYFIQERGIPQFLISLGRKTSSTALRSYLRRAAMEVDDVDEVLSVEITEFDPATRRLGGETRFSTVGNAAEVTARY